MQGSMLRLMLQRFDGKPGMVFWKSKGNNEYIGGEPMIGENENDHLELQYGIQEKGRLDAAV